MFSQWRGRRAARRVRPGDGHALQRYRWWQLFSRALFHLYVPDVREPRETWSVSVRIWGESDDGEVRAQLYRDGRHHATSRLPAVLPVTDGRIEVVASSFGLRRCHYVADDGREWQLRPDPASAEGRRQRLERDHPGLSRVVGGLSVMVLVAGVVVGLPQIVEQVTEIPPVAENVGRFTSPFQLPAVANVALLVATLLASTERALRLRYHWLLDGGLFDGSD